MFSLVRDVAAQVVEFRLADRERAVTALPGEITKSIASGFDPLRRVLSYFLHEFARSDSARRCAGDVDVILGAADCVSRAIERAAGSGEVFEQFGFDSMSIQG